MLPDPRARAGALCALAAVALAATTLTARPAAASNGAMPITNSARAAGRGGADIGVADDAFAIVTNPAGMSNIFGYQLLTSTQIRFSQTGYTNAFNADEVESTPALVPGLAVVWDFGAPEHLDDPESLEYVALAGPMIDEIPWTEYEEDIGLDIGVAISAILGSGGKATYRSPVFPNGESERSDVKVIGLHLGAAYRVGPRISVGFALTPMYASIDQAGLTDAGDNGTNGTVRNFNGNQLDPNQPEFQVNGESITWSQVFAVAGANDSFATSRVDIDDAVGFGVSATLGILVHVTDWLSVGISYRSPGFFGDIEGEATVDARASISQSGGLLDQIQASFLDNHLPNDGQFLAGNYDFTLSGFRTPQILGVGFGVRPLDRLLLAIDLKWINWSDAFDEFEIELTNGDSADLNEISGSSTIESKQLYRWRDQYVIAVGGAIALTDWFTLRLGYNYGRNPNPSETLSPFSGPTIEHHATIGGTFRFGRVGIDLAYAHGFLKATTIENSIVNGEFDGTRNKADQDTFWLGLHIDY